MTAVLRLVSPALAALALGVVGRVAAQSEMPKGSPFMAAGPAAATFAPNETIEFAAVRTIGKQTDINLYDTQGKKTHWIPVGGTVDGMTVVGYDARREVVMAKIGGVDKTLPLRKSRAAGGGPAPMMTAPAMSFNTPPPAQETFVQKIQPPPPASAPAATGETPLAAPTQPAPTPAQPAVPLTIARQEEEARMLVSDLLEIGMAQRKAYEEKQKQAADPNAAPAQPPANPPQGPNSQPNEG